MTSLTSTGEFGSPDEAVTFVIGGDRDVPLAREYAKAFAERSGFTSGDQIVIDAVLGEITSNILSFAGKGELVFASESSAGRTGIVIVARDQGPGIADVNRACTEGYSTSGRRGLGLAAARRLMDSFDIASAPGRGTTITMKKWRNSRG